MMKIDKIFGDKKGNTIIYILLAVGILMLIMSSSLTGSVTPKEAPELLSCSLSKQTEKILSEIKGVGSVSVMISYAEDDTEGKEGMFSTTQENTNSTVQGVLIVADGGGNPSVREKIMRAAKAALGVESHKIEVFERKEKQ